MKATATYRTFATPHAAAFAFRWLGAAGTAVRAALRAAGSGLYRITKARILLEHDPGRPARRA